MAIYALDSRFGSIIPIGSHCELLRMSRQFAGAEILLIPLADDFKTTSDRAIAAESGFDFTSVRELHLFSMDQVDACAMYVERRLSPPRGSPLYEGAD